MESVTEEIERLWSEHAGKAYSASANHCSLDDLIHDIRPSLSPQGSAKLEPWRSIYEEAVAWLSIFAIAFQLFPIKKLKKPELRPFLALTSNASSHALAVWELTRSGLDTPARVVTRALIENVYASIAMLHDEQLAHEFIAHSDPADAHKFWFKNLAPNKLIKRLADIESRTGLDAATIDSLKESRLENFSILSEAAHPSYVGGMLTAFPCEAEDECNHRIGGLGRPSIQSKLTYRLAAEAIWYYSMVVMHFGINEGCIPQLKEILTQHDDLATPIVAGYQVIRDLILNHANN